MELLVQKLDQINKRICKLSSAIQTKMEVESQKLDQTNNRMCELSSAIQTKMEVESQKLDQTNNRMCELSSAIQTKMDKFIDFCTKKLEKIAISAEPEPTCYSPVLKFSIIKDEDDFNSFLEKLEDETYFTSVVHHCRKMWAGQNYKPYDYLYSLTDLIFSREFVTHCTWTGGSTKGVKKFGFKQQHKLQTLYFNALTTVIPSATADTIVMFFKNLLKNSASRLKAKGVRASRQKNSTKKVTASENIENINDSMLPENDNTFEEFLDEDENQIFKIEEIGQNNVYYNFVTQ